jgi:hypothetical protein
LSAGAFEPFKLTDIDTLPVEPRVVGSDTVEVLLNDGSVLRALRSVCDGSGGCGVGNESGRYGTNLTTVDTTEGFEDGLVLGVPERLASGVLVGVESVDGGCKVSSTCTCTMFGGVHFLPPIRAEAELAESVMKESRLVVRGAMGRQTLTSESSEDRSRVRCPWSSWTCTFHR